MKNVSIDETAKILVANEPVVAKDFICQNQAVITTGLEAIKALVKNPILKGIVTIIAGLLEGVVENHCNIKS